MRVIKRRTLVEYWKSHSNTRAPLERWYVLTEKAEWKTPVDVKSTFPDVDPVIVASGSTVYVFNVGSHRLVVAIHFDHPRAFVLRLMDHKEYDRARWKDEL
jgi:mRNA interferase HigB